jgi:hypothetical protein
MPSGVPGKKIRPYVGVELAMKVNEMEERVASAEKKVAEVTQKVESSHTIHEDRTYTNVPTPKKVFDRKPFVVGSFLNLVGPYPVAGWILVVGPEGVRIRVTRDREPDVRECPFRTWDYIETHLRGGV